MFPYLDLDGFRRRTKMPSTDVLALDTRQPGWIAQAIATRSSYINTRLRKRYGVAVEGSSLPFGQNPPPLVAAGTAPPGVTLVGRPMLGSLQLVFEITVAGSLGTAQFRWSKDAGATWTPASTFAPDGAEIRGGIATGPAVALPGTGLTAAFSAGAYSTDNVYAAATPVPETVLGWLTALVTWDAYDLRGRDSNDPFIQAREKEFDLAIAEIKEAADSKEGLFDLPASEDVGSAVTTGGPLFYTEASPFVSADRQQRDGLVEDQAGFGSIIGRP